MRRITAGSSGSTGNAWRCRASRRSRASRPRCTPTAYPCAEAGGVIWAYMGPAEPAAAPARARVDAAAAGPSLHLQARPGLQLVPGAGRRHRLQPYLVPPRADPTTTTARSRRTWTARASGGRGGGDGRQGAALRGGGHGLRRAHRRPAAPIRTGAAYWRISQYPPALPHHAARGRRRPHRAVAYLGADGRHPCRQLDGDLAYRAAAHRGRDRACTRRARARTCASSRRPPPSPMATSAPPPTATTTTSMDWEVHQTRMYCGIPGFGVQDQAIQESQGPS